KRLGRGEFNAETTKVIHLTKNPQTKIIEDGYKKEIEQLQQENMRIKTQLDCALEQIDQINKKQYELNNSKEDNVQNKDKGIMDKNVDKDSGKQLIRLQNENETLKKEVAELNKQLQSVISGVWLLLTT
ncbi:MAG: hypothetical protein EZS28_050380, partial [Streblomastix strix]